MSKQDPSTSASPFCGGSLRGARLQAPHGPKLQRPIQEAMRTHEDDPNEAARRLAEVVEELGLQPYQRPKPLDVLHVEQVHLVYWMALVRGNRKGK